MKEKKEQTQMEKITANYEQFINGKEVNNNGKDLFNKALKKAAKPLKPRASK